jgi:hypothetical protein
MAVPRNSPCPCGSGKKYKNCCYKMNYDEMPVKKKEVVFDLPGYVVFKKQITDIDSIPVHNKNG